MGTQTPAKPISAGVTFNDVISQNPAAWAAAPPEEKNALADAYFVKHVATQEGFDKLAPEQRLELKTQFNQKYNVGTTGNNVNPFDKVTDIAQIGAESLLDPAIRAITANQIQPRTQQEALKRYPGIQTDPGLLGEAYRLHQNPIVQGAGSILGAMGGTAAIARQLPVAAARFAGGVLPAGLFSGATNATDALQGNQSPMQAIGNTVMQTAAAPFQRAGRIGNALLQGGVGYVSGAGNTLFNEAMTGQPINWQQANSEGVKQALLGAGIGAALPGARPQSTVKNPPVKVGKGPAPRMRVVPEVETQANQIERAIEAQRQAAINKRAIDERAQLQARREAVKTLYAKVANTVDPNAPPQMQAAVQKALERLKQSHDELSAEHSQKYGKQPKAAKPSIAPDSQEFGNLTRMVAQLRASGRGREADVMMSKFDQATKARVYDAVKRYETRGKQKQTVLKAEAKAQESAAKQEARRLAARAKQLEQEQKTYEANLAKVQALKDKQAQASEIAKGKAEAQKRQAELKQLRADITANAKILDAEAKAQKAEDATKTRALIARAKQLQREQAAYEASVQKIQAAKGKQAAAAEVARLKAETAKRQQELNTLKADIKQRSATQKTETPAPRREAKSYTDKPPVNVLQAKATIEKAIAEGKAITVEHRANKAGTRDESTWREKFDLPYAMVEKNVLVDADGTPLLTANGNPMSATTQKAKAMIDNGEARIIAKPAVRVINENGQVSYRYLEDMYGTVRVSKSAHPYNYRLDEDGKLQIFNAKGEPIEQVKANLTKDSEIEAAFSKMQGVVGRVNKGQKVSAEEVLRAAEDFEKTADLERAYNKLKPEAQKNLHKKLTGESC